MARDFVAQTFVRLQQMSDEFNIYADQFSFEEEAQVV
jgi:hypothetical protein